METHEERIHEVLRRWWGFDSFRPVQEQIVRAAMEGRDTLALMPTGGGKSLTYQVPTMAREGLCIVVTPLIALMKDQVDRLRARRIPAVAIHSGLSPRQIDIALDNCVYGDVKFLYVAPERLATEAFRLRVVRMNVSLLAVDEAHCISQWGYDFRPSYLRIAELRERLPGVPVLALTASATKPVAKDIMRHLRFAEPHILRSSFARPNLSYSVRRTDDKQGQLLRLVQNVPGSGIVYMRTREGTEQVADMLRRQGVTAAAYHGGLGHAERALRQEEWLADKVRVMVATNAFGMGIDKPDVRFVVHYALCDSLESYYQEAGRAGRDGRRAYALLLVAADDSDRIARRFEQEFPPLERVKEIYERVCSYLRVGIGEGGGSSYLFNLHDFCAREHLWSGDRRRSPEAPPAERLPHADRRTGQPGAHPLLHQPGRALQAPRPARRPGPLHPHDPAPLQRRLHRVSPHRRRGAGHVERLHRRAGPGAAQNALAAARDPLHPLEPLADPLPERGTAAPRGPLHRPRDLPPKAAAHARTLRAHGRLRRQRRALPQRGARILLRGRRPRAVRRLRHLPRAQTGREGRPGRGCRRLPRRRSRRRGPRGGASAPPGRIPGRPAYAGHRNGLRPRTADAPPARIARKGQNRGRQNGNIEN